MKESTCNLEDSTSWRVEGNAGTAEGYDWEEWRSGGIHRCAHFDAIYICLGVGDGNEDVISLKFG